MSAIFTDSGQQKLGLKNIITQAQDLLPDVFKDLPSSFPTSILDKILESKEGKKFICRRTEPRRFFSDSSNTELLIPALFPD